MRPAAPLKTMQTLRGIAVSPGVAIGPPQVIDPRGLRLPHRAIAAEAVDAELRTARPRPGTRPGRGRGRRGRGPAAARAPVRRHPRRPRPDDHRPDLAPRRPGPDRARQDRRRARRQRGPRGARRPGSSAWPTRTWPPAPPTCATSSSGSSASSSGEVRSAVVEDQGGPTVILAHDLSPSETAGLDPLRVLGFATEAGGRASHTAIVAAALEIPAVVGLGTLPRPRPGVPDGDHRRRRGPGRPRPRRRRPSSAIAGPPPSAPPGSRGSRAWPTSPPRPSTASRVGLWGNIEFPGEVAACLERGADGVGLYRTEFLYLNADRAPTEEEQFAAYAAVVRSLKGRPVTIRTLDLGADKMASYHPGAGPGERELRPGAPEPPALAPRPGAVPDPAPGDPPGQHAGRRPRALPAGLHAGRVPPGAGRPGRRRLRAERRGGRRPRRPPRRRHGRGARRRRHGRPTRQGGGLLLDRDQRPDPVHPGRRPDRRDGRRPLQRGRPRRAPADRHGGRRGGASRTSR